MCLIKPDVEFYRSLRKRSKKGFRLNGNVYRIELDIGGLQKIADVMDKDKAVNTVLQKMNFLNDSGSKKIWYGSYINGETFIELEKKYGEMVLSYLE